MDIGYCDRVERVVFGSTPTCWKFIPRVSIPNHIIYLKVEFDNLDQLFEDGVIDALLNVLDEKCAENTGVKNGIQFHRIDPKEEAKNID
jgi:hypothetical protein